MNLPPIRSRQRFHRSEWRAVAFSVVILVTSTILAYSNSFSGPFLFDDIPTIVESSSIRNLGDIGSVLFEGDTSALGRPLLNLSFALNYAFGGLAIAPYHVVNLVLHILAGIVLMGVIRRTLTHHSGSQACHDSQACNGSLACKEHAEPISRFCALIWLLHPLQTESVTYVTQRAESLVGLFYLLTLYCSIRARSFRRSVVWPTAAFFACLCGVASKEVMVSAPLAVVMYDLTFSGRNRWLLLRQRRRFYAWLFSTWIPLFLLISQGRQASAGFGFGLSSWDYLKIQFGAITRYLRLSLWPDALVLDYGVGALQGPTEILPSAILVSLLAVVSLVAIKYQPWIAFLGFLFFAELSPSSSIIPIVTQTAAEHRMYLPLASVTVIAVVGIWQTCIAISKWRQRDNDAVQRAWIVPSCLLSLMACSFGYLTFARNFEYADAIRLWSTNIQRWPESLRPYMLIGSEFLEKKRDALTAIAWYDRAVASYQTVRQQQKWTKHVDLQLAGVYFGRGTAHSQLRNFEQALADFDRTLELNPKIVNAHFYRGMVLGQLGREDEAIASLTQALELEVSPERLYIRGDILGRQHKYLDAINDLSLAIRLDPFNPSFYQSRGQSLFGLGRYPDALGDLSEALRLFPDYVNARKSRGMVYAAMNRHAEAIDDFSQVIVLAPRLAEAYQNRAHSLLIMGKTADARQDLQTFESLSGQTDQPLRERLGEVVP